MRHHLFRGQRVDNKKWVFGYYAFQRALRWMKCQVVEEYDNDRHLILLPNNKHYLVIPETVGEYTGKLDIEGKRIFEGDIIQHLNQSIYQVIWSEEGACFYPKKIGKLELADFIGFDRMRIIGNIHDNNNLRPETTLSEDYEFMLDVLSDQDKENNNE